MKISLLLSSTLLALPQLATANFHVGWQVLGGQATNYICPSNHFNCLCIANGDRRYQVNPRHGVLSRQDHFSANNVCGVKKIDFWRRGDGHYDMYINQGDGKVVGTCWPADTEKSCYGERVGWKSDYWCDSYICGK